MQMTTVVDSLWIDPVTRERLHQEGITVTKADQRIGDGDREYDGDGEAIAPP